MPTITITTSELSTEKKKALIEGFTKVSMEVTGAPEQFHSVLIHELPMDAMGVGKKSVEEIVKEMKK